ncbi:MAG: sodium:solute symporter family protein [Acidobacteriota bacterium]
MSSLFILQIIPPGLAEDASSHLSQTLTVLAAYLVVLGVISYLARSRYTGEFSDYVTASRSLGWVVTTLTILATIWSGVALAGFPGSVYALGAPFMTSVILGLCTSAPLIWFFGRRIWILGQEHDFITPGDLLGGYYQSDTVRVYTVIASLVFNLAYTVAQLLAGGILLNVLSAGAISFDGGMVIIAVVVLVHVTTTGIRGIAWLDTFNGTLILVILAVFSVYIIRSAGGMIHVFTGLGRLQTLHTSLPGTSGIFTPLQTLVFGAVFVSGTAVVSPAVWVRMYAIRKKEELFRVSVAFLVLMTLIHVFGTYFIGTYARVVFPDIENPDFVSSLLAFDLMPFGVAALFLVAVLAAIISTTDSYLHVLAVTVVRDLVRAVFMPEMKKARELNLNYLVITLAAGLSVVLALLYPGFITPLAVVAGGLTIQLFPLLFGAVVWPRASTEAAIIAPLGGVFTLVGVRLNLFSDPFSSPMLPGIVASLCVNFFLFVLISYFTRPQPLERIEAFHGVIRKNL